MPQAASINSKYSPTLDYRLRHALRVVAFNTAEGWSWDVSEDIALEVLQRALDADDHLSGGTNASLTAMSPIPQTWRRERRPARSTWSTPISRSGRWRRPLGAFPKSTFGIEQTLGTSRPETTPDVAGGPVGGRGPGGRQTRKASFGKSGSRAWPGSARTGAAVARVCGRGRVAVGSSRRRGLRLRGGGGSFVSVPGGGSRCRHRRHPGTGAVCGFRLRAGRPGSASGGPTVPSGGPVVPWCSRSW